MFKKNKKGSVVILSVFFVFIFMLIAMNFVDFSRYNFMKSKAKNVLKEELINSLSFYNKDLYENYNIYGLDFSYNLENKKIQESTDILNKISDKNNSVKFYNVKNIKSSVNGINSYDDLQNLKYIIVKSHGKDFLVNRAEDIIKKIIELKGVFKVKSVSESYKKLLIEFGKLDKDINKIKTKKEELLDKAIELDKMDINVIIDEMKNINDFENDLDKVAIRNNYSKLKSFENGYLNLINSLENFGFKLEKYAKKSQKSLNEFNNFRDDETINQDFLNKVIDDIQNKFDNSMNSKDQIFEMVNDLNFKLDSLKSSINNYEFDFDYTLEEYVDFIDIEDISFFSVNNTSYNREYKKIWKSIKKMLKVGILKNYKIYDTNLFEYENILNSSLDKDFNINENNDYDIDEVDLKDEIEIDESISYSSDIDKNYNDNILKTNYDRLVVCDYIVNYFSNATHYQGNKKISSFSKDPLKFSQVEYVISGNKTMKNNVKFVNYQIYALRMALNLPSILINKSKEISSISAGISAITFGLAYPIVYSAVVLSFDAIESNIDLKMLQEGKKVPIVKVDKLYFDFDISNLSKLSKDILKNTKNVKSDSDDETNLSFDYKDYLTILLFFKNENQVLSRIKDVINVDFNSKGKDFDINKMFSGVDGNIEFDIKYYLSSLFSKIKVYDIESY